MNLPTGSRGSLLALALLFIPLIVLGKFLLAPPLAKYLNIREEISDSQDQLRRYIRVAENLPFIELASRELREKALLTPFLVPGQSKALAAANLQQHVLAIAELSDARVMSMRVGTPMKNDTIEEVPIEARMQVPAERLLDLLYEIESSRPLIFIRKLDIRGRSKSRRLKNSSADALHVVIRFHGLRIPEEGETSA